MSEDRKGVASVTTWNLFSTKTGSAGTSCNTAVEIADPSCLDELETKN